MNLRDYIEQKFNSLNLEGLEWGDVYDLDEVSSISTHNITCEVVEQVGGQDQGSHIYAVYKFTKDDETVYVKVYGWYASYVGSEAQGWCFVEPKEKTVTVYESV